VSITSETGTATVGTGVTVTFLPEGTAVAIAPGTTVLQASRAAGVHVDAPCGDRGRCGKCRVRVVSGTASEPDAEETALLKPAELAQGIRLACELRPTADLVVEVPETSRNLAHRKATAEIRRAIAPEPYTRKTCVAVARPSLEGADLRDDFTRLCEALPGIADADLDALRGLHAALVAGDYTVTAVTAGDRLLAVEAGDTADLHYGVALDIGTTTIVGYLLDLTTGREVTHSVQPNPQAAYGADVISRIEFAMGDQAKVETLRRTVTEAANMILHTLASEAGTTPDHIYEMTVVGNTCMSHLFLGLDPLPLGHAPYTPVVTAFQEVTAVQMGLALHPNGRVRTLPNIAGFVGADTVGVLAAGDLKALRGLHVAVDIGTNCEVLLAMDGRVTACSTAAGPAFEGAKISHGMRAQPGAIDQVTIDDDLRVHTIGETAPRGICGSGVIDILGELRRLGIIESSGRFAEPEDLPALPPTITARLREDGIVLVHAADSGTGHDILFTQQDVREIQLVKAAIYAGIATLLDKMGRAITQLDSVLIAGAFGTYINRNHAINIGLIPDVGVEKLIFLGNAAGAGAKMALISRDEFAAITHAADGVEYVELAGDETFRDNFAMAMLLAPGCEDDW
jgi:uncharacterized 2Fe-2S/4Fe-4S cluster protein (DUF4445 family)